MDGAAKFVKGDAIAGILILVINIIGGLIVKVGSKMIDTSLLNKINKLKIVIKEA